MRVNGERKTRTVSNSLGKLTEWGDELDKVESLGH